MTRQLTALLIAATVLTLVLPAAAGHARRLHSPLAPASSWWSTGAPAATRPT